MARFVAVARVALSRSPALRLRKPSIGLSRTGFRGWHWRDYLKASTAQRKRPAANL